MVQLRVVETHIAPPQGPAFTLVEEQAMQRAVVRLFGLWTLRDSDAAILLGDMSVRTFQRWKEGSFGRAGPDLCARMSNLIGIHKALRLLFTDKDRAHNWVNQPNSAFGGASALAIMLGGQLTDIMRVRRYLDAQRAFW
jgi:hypothetical protein